MMPLVDLRSDTITHPTEAMREAMRAAPVGADVMVEQRAHCYLNEAGGMSALAGVIPRPIPGECGFLTVTQIEAVLRPPNLHFAPTRLLCLENTHNAPGGP